MKSFLLLILASTLTFSACGSDSSDYDPNWGDGQSLPAGKGDFLDLAEVIEFDEEKEGSVTSTQMDVYKISLKRGDELTLTKHVTSGDLRPDISLFSGFGSSIRSLDFNVSSKKLTKDYQVDDTGDYLIAVRAFRNEGSGDYRISAECTGGPCNGELTDPADFFDVDTVIDCVRDTQECAFKELPRFNGAVGKVRSTNIWNDCAAKTATFDGESCETACDSSEDASELCNFIVSELPFFADQDAACFGEFDSCMSECQSIGDSFSSDIWDQEYAVCWSSGLNSDCPNFVKQLEACGGNLTDDAAICIEECHATSGAFTDDTQDLCDHCDTCGVLCMSQSQGEDFTHLDGLIGDVDDTFIGEIDPFILGDVCVVYVEVYDGIGDMEPGIYGLLEDGVCQALDMRLGDPVNVADSDLETIGNPDEIDELTNLRDVTYFRISPDAIEEVF